MTTTQPDPQQAQLEQMVTRIARRAADAVAQTVADLGVQLALARETVEGQAVALAEKDRQIEEKDAELARAYQTADQLRQHVAELERPTPADSEE